MTDFYQVAGLGAAIATVVITAAAAWVSWRSVPKLRLFYRMPDPVSLIAVPEGLPHKLELQHEGRPIVDPRIVEIVLHSSGRQAIRSDLFDQGSPLIFDLAAPIIDVLKTGSTPAEAPVPQYRTTKSILAVGPALLARHQIVRFSLLVDGKPTLRCQSPLADVNIRRQINGLDPDSGLIGRWWGQKSPAARRALVAGSLSVLLVVSPVSYYILFATHSSEVGGSVACNSGRTVVGVWISASSGQDDSGYANLGPSGSAGGNHPIGSGATYSYLLPQGGTYSVNVGCGGTAAQWASSNYSPLLSTRTARLNCDDPTAATAHRATAHRAITRGRCIVAS